MHRLSDPLAVNWASRAGGGSSKLEAVPPQAPRSTDPLGTVSRSAPDRKSLL